MHTPRVVTSCTYSFECLVHERNPWVIPIKFLVNLDENGKISENQNLKRNKQNDIHISKIKYIEIPVQANSKKNGTESDKSKEEEKDKKKSGP